MAVSIESAAPVPHEQCNGEAQAGVCSEHTSVVAYDRDVPT